MGTTTTDSAAPAAEAARARIATAIETLVELEEYIDSMDGWRSVALQRFVNRWTDHDAGMDRYWFAVAELLSANSSDPRGGRGFDDGLRAAIIRLLVAADKGSDDRAEADPTEPYLKISTFREMEVAHESIGKELDRIRREA